MAEFVWGTDYRQYLQNQAYVNDIRDAQRGAARDTIAAIGDSSRSILGPIVREALLELSEQAGLAEYVFTHPDTGTRYADVKKSFSAAFREAGITNFTFHDLRHTFGTRLADAGVDVVKIKELMGHA